VTYQEVAQALHSGMGEALSRKFRELPLSDLELEQAAKLARERYENPTWTLAR
jgi:lipoate-protein ligase A